MKLVFDVGATMTRLAQLENGKLGEIVRFETDATSDGFGVMRQRIRELVGTGTLEAIAGDVPGDLTSEGEIISARNLPNWNGQKIVEQLTTDFGCPAQLFNDVVLCGVGEAHHGAGTATGETMYLTVSTGVNAVRLLDGYADPRLTEPNMGRMIIAGGPGHPAELELLIGGAAVERRTGHHPKEIREPAFWEQEAAYLARAIFNARIFWRPTVVVLGGSMMRDIPIDAIQKTLNALPDVFYAPIELKLAQLGDEAGLYGAMMYLEKPA